MDKERRNREILAAEIICDRAKEAMTTARKACQAATLAQISYTDTDTDIKEAALLTYDSHQKIEKVAEQLGKLIEMLNANEEE